MDGREALAYPGGQSVCATFTVLGVCPWGGTEHEQESQLRDNAMRKPAKDYWNSVDISCVVSETVNMEMTTRPVSHSRFSSPPANSVLSRRQPTHIG